MCGIEFNISRLLFFFGRLLCFLVFLLLLLLLLCSYGEPADVGLVIVLHGYRTLADGLSLESLKGTKVEGNSFNVASFSAITVRVVTLISSVRS